MQTDDVTATSQEEMANLLLGYYEQLLGQEMSRETSINFGMIGIDQLDLFALELPFTEEEVWRTLRDLLSDKSPGPDGMTGAFYKTA
jgi:hypothetical protein